MKFVFFIGAMKSGTTSLYQYLSQHPQLARCEQGKEFDFFTESDLWKKGFESFRSQWDFNPDVHEYALGGSTTYTMVPHRPNAAERIRQSGGNFRFLYILRDPFTRIPSHFFHAKYSGDLPKEQSIDAALRNVPQLLDFSRYASQLEEYDRRFGPQSTFVLTLERLAAEPEAVLDEICDFVGVAQYNRFQNLDRTYNSRDDQVQDGLLVKVLQQIQPMKEMVRRTIPLGIRSVIKRHLGDSDPAIEYPKLGPDAEVYIQEELSEELDALVEDERVDVSSWNCVE